MKANCCICGSTNDATWCGACQHNFCAEHRLGLGNLKNWHEAVWLRGVAAVKEWLTGNPPAYCDHTSREEAA